MPRKKASKKYSDEKFKLIFEYSPIAIWEENLFVLTKLNKLLQDRTVTNLRRYLIEHPDLVKRTFRGIKILNVNKAAIEMYGAKDKQQLISHFGKNFTKDLFNVLVDEFSELLKGNLYFEAEFKSRTLKGKNYDVLLKVSVPEKYKKTFSRAIVTLQDITERKKLERHLRKLAQLDSLTRLYNHSTIITRLEAELLRAKRYGSSLSCMMIDVDHFKVINDEYGHQKGDQIIKRVAATLKSSIRRVDVIGRYGGDEFLVILPETKPESTKVAAGRVQEIFTNKKFLVKKGLSIHIALSIGIAGYPGRGIKEAKDLITKADKAMYLAKKSGDQSFMAAV